MQNCRVNKAYMPEKHKQFWKTRLFAGGYGHENSTKLLKLVFNENKNLFYLNKFQLPYRTISTGRNYPVQCPNTILK